MKDLKPVRVFYFILMSACAFVLASAVVPYQAAAETNHPVAQSAAQFEIEAIFLSGLADLQNGRPEDAIEKFSAILAANAFIFLVPMMPEILALAEASIPAGELSEAFHAPESREALVGASNVIPLITEMVMGDFKPRLSKAERAA